VWRGAMVTCGCVSETDVAGRAEQAVAAVAGGLRSHFRRGEAREHATDYLRGLLADVERKNGWQLAERVGYEHPRGIQRVLDRYAWDADAVRDDLLRWTIAEIGHPDGVVVVDETSFPKQGKGSVGVARQYCGALGKVANCQVGVFLGYASPAGHVGIDRALYLPEKWVTDPERRAKAKIPADATFRTKPELARHLVARALDAGLPAAWVTADEVYGNDPAFRRFLEERGQRYVLAVKRTTVVTATRSDGLLGEAAVGALIAAVPPDAWNRLSCGEGSQGPRTFDWAYITLDPAERPGWIRGVLLRRHPTRTDEVACYLVYAPADTPLPEIVRAAGARWSIEDVFHLAKGEVGLDHYEVRSWHGWHRHITLALVALFALTLARRKGGPPTARSTSPSPSPRSAASSSDSSGPRPTRPHRSSPGRGGDAVISGSLSCAIAAAG
jgi:SRSO17 transposase